MKKLLFLILPLILLAFYSGCSDDAVGTTGGDPFGGGGGGGGGTGNVTIQVQGQQEQDGYYFYIKPSAAITVATVTASVAAENYNETINIGVAFTTDGFQSILKYTTGVQTGQAWKFQFKGTVTNGGAAFDVTTNYTTP